MSWEQRSLVVALGRGAPLIWQKELDSVLATAPMGMKLFGSPERKNYVRTKHLYPDRCEKVEYCQDVQEELRSLAR